MRCYYSNYLSISLSLIVQEICAKTTKPRDAFDVKEQRLVGTEAEAYKDIDSTSKTIAKDKWKKTHNKYLLLSIISISISIYHQYDERHQGGKEEQTTHCPASRRQCTDCFEINIQIFIDAIKLNAILDINSQYFSITCLIKRLMQFFL